MVSLTIAAVVIIAVLVAVAARVARSPAARTRYWAGIAEILADESLTDSERDRALEARYASRPF